MKYWAYVNNEILGPFEKEKLLELPSFAPGLLICPQTPVGEKTEDWKEAASYPEISAALGSGTLQNASPSKGLNVPGISAAQPSSTQHGQDLKALTPAPVDPVPPKESNFGGVKLEVGHLERSGRMAPAAEPARQSAASFDPISMSSISRKADTISAAEIPAGNPADSIAKEPQPSFSAPVPEPVQAREIFPSPQPASAGAAPDSAGLAELGRKLEALAQNSASRQDLAAFGDPLRMKLDQMGEVLSSMKNSQFQREIMDKLAYLENTLGDIKATLKDDPAAPASAASQAGAASATVFGAHAPAREEKAKPVPPENPAAAVVTNQDDKKPALGAKLASMVKAPLKVMMTLVLVAAVLFVAVIALKNAEVFDASKFIPSSIHIPFLTTPAKSAAAPQLPSPAAEQTGTEGKQLQIQSQTQFPAQPEAKPAEKPAPDISPEVIYFARYYKAGPEGPKLEDKISEIAAAAGGKYSSASWQAKKTGPDLYEAASVIPGKDGDMTFTFTVDYAKKTLLPANPTGESAFNALSKAEPARTKKPGRKSKKRSLKKAAAPATQQSAAAPKAKSKPGSAKKAGKPDEEFEYVYEDEQ